MSKFITVMGEPNELGYDMSNVIVGDPMANVIVGYDDELGVSFFKKIGRAVGKAGKGIGKGVGSVARTVSKPLGSVMKLASTVTKIPGVGVVFAAAGPPGLAALASVKIVDQLRRGTPKGKAAARTILRNTKKAAQMGNPQAIKGLRLIQAAARKSLKESRMSGEDDFTTTVIGGHRVRQFNRRPGLIPINVRHAMPGPAMTGRLCLPNGVCVNGTFIKVR